MCMKVVKEIGYADGLLVIPKLDASREFRFRYQYVIVALVLCTSLTFLSSSLPDTLYLVTRVRKFLTLSYVLT